jgi:formylglycine-generating enzyme required for sulfatase activity
VAAVAALLALLSACGERAARPVVPAASPAPEGAPDAPSPEAVAAALGMPATFENFLGMRFAIVPGGTFRVGDGPETDVAAAHEVTLYRDYYLQTSEVTRGQWARYAGLPPPPGAEADVPVSGVSHAEADAFVRWVDENDPKWGYRLPREVEWERARLCGRPLAGPEAESPWGHRGMTSSPAEWCSDWYAPFPSWHDGEPWGPSEGAERVVRPGPADHLAGRQGLAPDRRHEDVGFRLLVPVGYGGDERGRYRVTFRTRGGAPGMADGPEVSGCRVRVIQVLDRLTARQLGQRLRWTTLEGTSSPLTVRLVPGRYYGQCVVMEGEKPLRGLEMKFTVDHDDLVVDLPLPHPAAMLQEPE